MRQINESVKAKKFTTLLGAEIYEICELLKTRGKQLEEAHKGELSSFFTSIRQAACRESGKLGLPCRLRVMELLELRVLGWRTNLSHAQYFSRMELGLEGAKDGCQCQPLPAFPNPSASAFCSQLPPPPASVPVPLSSSSSSSVPLPSFGIPPPPLPPPPYLLHSPDPMPSPAGFFLIPSRAGSSFLPANLPPPQQGMCPSPSSPHKFSTAPSSLLGNHQKFFTKNYMPNLLEGLSIDSEFGMAKAKTLCHQFREEITIRNSDSGKVMGVKGRRVALIEAVSKAVISFQKVDPKCRERQLTIVADEKGAIECAKRLIAETIERNVSPERPFDLEKGKNLDVDPPKEEERAPIRIAREADGSLKIGSADPSILEALHECLRRMALPNGRSKQESESDGQGRTNAFPMSSIEPGLLAYDRSKLLDIRQNCWKDEKLLAEAKRKFEKFDIFLGTPEEGTSSS